MKWSHWLEQWGMSSLKISVPFLEMEWAPRDEDRSAAWEMYIELLTRIATQNLAPEEGDEKTALDSIHSLFGITREVLRRNGRHCTEFAKIAIVILNQKIRPFTARWHRRSLAGDLATPRGAAEFRNELGELQKTLRAYTQMLASISGVEDLTHLQAT
jgi:hypothetical protein